MSSSIWLLGLLLMLRDRSSACLGLCSMLAESSDRLQGAQHQFQRARTGDRMVAKTLLFQRARTGDRMVVTTLFLVLAVSGLAMSSQVSQGPSFIKQT